MKATVVAFAALIVGIVAAPSLLQAFASNDERIVTWQIRRAIEQAAQSIRDAGYDPYELSTSYEYELPVPVIFAASAIVDNLVVTGISNIVVNRMDYGIITNRLTFTITLPSIKVSIDNSGFAFTFFGEEHKGSASGILEIQQIRVRGNIRLNISIISGISVRSVRMQFDLRGIQSNLNVNIFGVELSEHLNTYFGSTLPATIKEFESEINQLLDIVTRSFLDQFL